MALPTIKYPTYKLTVPSTGKVLEYRPFTVSEEKVLLTSLQGEDTQEMLESTESIIKACFKDVGDVEKLTSYDIEYMFINLRAKSVSNVVGMKFRHKECPTNHGNPSEYVANIKINLEDAHVQVKSEEGYVDYTPPKGNKDNVIQLESDLGVVMRHPGLKSISKTEYGDDVVDDIIMDCIVSVFDEEEIYDTFTREELSNFYNTLTTKHKEKIVEFISNIPKLRYESKFRCKDCGHEEPIVFEGFRSFFN